MTHHLNFDRRTLESRISEFRFGIATIAVTATAPKTLKIILQSPLPHAMHRNIPRINYQVTNQILPPKPGRVCTSK